MEPKDPEDYYPPNVVVDDDEDDFEPPDCPAWFESWFQ